MSKNADHATLAAPEGVGARVATESAQARTPASSGSSVGRLVGVTVFATLWSRFLRRGPLERLLGKATKPAELVR